MTDIVLGILMCPVFNDKLVNNLIGDADIDKIMVLTNQFTNELCDKLDASGLRYESIPEFEGDNDAFQIERNKIGALLGLPKSPNASYQDDPYSKKIEQYFDQNILAQSLNKKVYTNHPDFEKFIKKTRV